MKSPIEGYWGKLDREGSGDWHPLLDHCADVAACFVRILDVSSLRARLERLAERSLSDVDSARLAVLATLHDIGKFNHGFQGMASGGDPCGHVAEVIGPLQASNSKHTARLFDALADVLEWNPDGLLLLASICHHGRPADGTTKVGIWEPKRGRDPVAGIESLVAECRQWFPAAWSEGPVLPQSPAFNHAFVGLVTLADWIGSHTDFFPYSETDDGTRFDWALERATLALRWVGLDTQAARRPHIPVFADVSEHPPRSMQSAVLKLPTSPGESLVFLEAETGSGKTEAALARFVRLHQAGEVDGMYFAVPTRAAAVQLHERLRQAMERAFGDDAPPVTLAVPGYLKVDDQLGKHLPKFEVLWDDAADATRHRGWSVENPKRYFAGGVIVGTIDQVLLSSLMTKHAALRATGLLRLLLVIDEVHASDRYMTRVSEEVLRFHLAAGGHAMLMSATLGSAARTRYEALVSSGRHPLTCAEAVEVVYPRVAHGCELVPIESELQEQKIVEWSVEPWADRIEDSPEGTDYLAERVAEAVASGARVLVIRNTVADARHTQERFEKRGLPTLSCNGVPVPHHSRYARDDRKLLDHAVEEGFGKDAIRGTGLVCVATQTVEQSLDIDADLLLTDLCPVDVLLQRIGRLHRHVRERPSSCELARCVVLVPASMDLASHIRLGCEAGRGVGPHGAGTVYEDLRILDATFGLIEIRPTIQIPRDNRDLVEHATHPEILARWALIDEPWQKHAQYCDATQMTRGMLADLNVLDRTVSYPENTFERDRRVPTRLGANDRILEMPTPFKSPLGSTVRHLTIPGFQAERLSLGAEPNVKIVATSSDSTEFIIDSEHSFTYDRMGLRWD